MILYIQKYWRTLNLAILPQTRRYTVDRENFAELYFGIFNFSAFNFRHLASIYIVGIGRNNFSCV